MLPVPLSRMVTPYANHCGRDHGAPGRIMPVTNLLERMFGEERRRTKVIAHAFGERAVMKCGCHTHSFTVS